LNAHKNAVLESSIKYVWQQHMLVSITAGADSECCWMWGLQLHPTARRTWSAV